MRPGESAERQAFASFGGVAAVVLLLQVTIFDLRYVGGLVLDRYLIYLVPLVLLGFVSALQQTRPLRLSLVLVAALVSVGFAVGAIPTEHLAAINSDAPIQAFYPPLVAAATSLTDARVFLIGATLLSTAAFVAGRTLLSKRRFLLVFMLVPVVCLPLLTEDLFARFFHDKGWSFRAVTSGSGESYGWFDQKVGPAADVTIIPYPTSSDYFVSEREVARLRVLEQVGRPGRPALHSRHLRLHERHLPEALPELQPDDREGEHHRQPLRRRGRPGDPGAHLRRRAPAVRRHADSGPPALARRLDLIGPLRRRLDETGHDGSRQGLLATRGAQE